MSRSPEATSSTATLIETGRRVCRLCDRQKEVCGTVQFRVLHKACSDLGRVMAKRLFPTMCPSKRKVPPNKAGTEQSEAGMEQIMSKAA